MPRLHRLPFALIFAASLAIGQESPPAAGAPAASALPTEAQFLAKMPFVAGKTVQYRDEQGKPIDYDEFARRFAVARALSTAQDSANRTVIFSIPDPAKIAASRNAPPIKLKAGEAIPPVKLATLDGKPFDNAALAGKPVLLSFFFSTCEPCIHDVPLLNDFARRNPDVTVAAITFDKPATAKEFVEKYKLDWPVVAEARAFINALGVRGYPTFVLLDGESKVVAAKSGLDTKAATNVVAEWAEPLLKDLARR